ncbi:MAG: M15 family metallopeptidase [Actinomycetota bacterium]
MKRLAASLAIFLSVAACGARPDVFETPVEHGTASARSIQLPDVTPASPAFLVQLPRPIGGGGLESISKTRGVAVVAPVTTARLEVRGPRGPVGLEVAVVDPLSFRSIAPASTRDAEFVWTSLLAGEAVVTFDAARKLGLREAGAVDLDGAGTVIVGAFADNGVPNVADLLVGPAVGQRLGVGGPSLLAVGSKTGATIEVLGRSLRRRLPNARLTRMTPSDPARLEPPAAPQPIGTAGGGLIGTLHFKVLKGGFVEPDSAWVAANIATSTVPILGSVRCHRLIFDQLRAALAEIEREGLTASIRPGDYGGCYVPRFIDRDPRRPLSMHAFGLAFDINVSTNDYGTRGDLDPRIVEVFERWGFAWGGRWSAPDPMHFELARLLRPNG